MLSKDVQVAVSLFALATAQSLPAFVAAHSELIEGNCVWFFLFFGTCMAHCMVFIKKNCIIIQFLLCIIWI